MPTHERAPEMFDAVDAGDLEKMQALLDEGVPPGVVIDDDGNTPLHKAAAGELALVQALLVAIKGDAATLNCKNSASETALMAAVKYEDSSVIEALVAGGVTVDEEVAQMAKKLDVPEVRRALFKEDVEDSAREKTGAEEGRRVSQLDLGDGIDKMSLQGSADKA